MPNKDIKVELYNLIGSDSSMLQNAKITNMANLAMSSNTQSFKNVMNDYGWNLALRYSNGKYKGEPYNNGWLQVTASQLKKIKTAIQNNIPTVNFGKSQEFNNFINGPSDSIACVQFYTNKQWYSSPVINWFKGDCSNPQNTHIYLDFPSSVNNNGTILTWPNELSKLWMNSHHWVNQTYTDKISDESYTIYPSALYEEGLSNMKQSSCFTTADSVSPYTNTHNGLCQKNTMGEYGTSFGYNTYQHKATYDPNSSLNYGPV
jgi:hypothetical protein